MRQTLLMGIVMIVVTAFAGCVSVRSGYYHGRYRDPRPEGAVVEILEAEDIHQPYRVIGIVDATASRGTNLLKVMERLKDATRRMGGEALIDLQYKSVGTGVPITLDGSVYFGYVRDLWQARVIVWERAREDLN